MTSLLDIIQKTGAKVVNPSHIKIEKFCIKSIAALDQASSEEISFLFDEKWRESLKTTKAGVVCLKSPSKFLNCIQLIHREPKEALADIGSLFENETQSFTGVSASSYVSASAHLHSSVTVYPNVYIDDNASIAANCVLYPSVYIGANCSIGENSIIFPHSVLMRATIVGRNVIIHPCCVIGSEGFGFLRSDKIIKKIPQFGNVILEDNVEVGAGSTIDRATFHSTTIQQGTKIDSQVHIGHNVQIGEHSILCGQVGVSGSVRIGKNFTAAGKAAIAPGLEIGENVILAANSGVSGHKEANKTYAGSPALEIKSWRKQVVISRNLPALLARVKDLEKKLEQLESKIVQK